MIKWVHLTARAKSAQDFEILVQLLETLGLRKGFVSEDENARSAEFLPTRHKLDLIFRKKPWTDVDLTLWVQNPDTAKVIVKRKNLDISEEGSGPELSHDVCHFTVTLAGGTRLMIMGARVHEGITDTDYSGEEGSLSGAGKHFGVVVSRFNSFITERLVAGAIDGLVRSGVEQFKGYDIVRVPGSFEIPSAARTLAETGKYDAIICLGCLLRGDTAHYDVIANEVTRGIGQSAQETGVPHAFGVLTCDTLEQAIDRAGLKSGNKGFEAALAAVEMANLKKSVLGRQSSVVSKKKAVSTQHSALSKKTQIPRSARNDNSSRARKINMSRTSKSPRKPRSR